MIHTYDGAIQMIENFFGTKTYDEANHILDSLLCAKIAHTIPGSGRISMPDLGAKLKSNFEKEI